LVGEKHPLGAKIVQEPFSDFENIRTSLVVSIESVMDGFIVITSASRCSPPREAIALSIFLITPGCSTPMYFSWGIWCQGAEFIGEQVLESFIDMMMPQGTG